MDKQNANHLQEEAERKFKRREKKKKIKMKVSGASVRNLQKIISEKLNSKSKITNSK